MNNNNKQSNLSKYVVFSIIGMFFVISITYFIISAIGYANRFGSLEGDFVFNEKITTASSSEDSMRVYLVDYKIQETIDQLNVEYEKNTDDLINEVTRLKRISRGLKDNVIKAEIIFETSYKNLRESSRLFIKASTDLKNLKQESKDTEIEYLAQRDSLLNIQGTYNLKVATLIDMNTVLKTLVDDDGHFSFPKTENGEFLIYALRVIVAGEDITNVPAEMYYVFALTGKKINKYIWLTKVVIEEATYIKLDSSNMIDVFK